MVPRPISRRIPVIRHHRRLRLRACHQGRWTETTRNQPLCAAARTRDLTGEGGADIIFDPVDGPFLEKLAQAAAPGATILEYGSLSLARTPYPLFEARGKGLSSGAKRCSKSSNSLTC